MSRVARGILDAVACTLVVAGVWSCCARPETSHDREDFGLLELSISTTRESIQYPYPLPLILSITNTGSESVVVRPPGAQRDHVRILSESEPLPNPRFRIGGGLVHDDHAEDFIVLEPGASRSGQISLEWETSPVGPCGQEEAFLHLHEIKSKTVRVVVLRETFDQGGVYTDGCFRTFQEFYGAKAFTGEVRSNQLLLPVVDASLP